ncbi:hypothetical protein FM103_05545 [Corynebacterium xerosis]|nr:hypothetical protein FM103_05545 [Corynebacterium xerosis]
MRVPARALLRGPGPSLPWAWPGPLLSVLLSFVQSVPL